jgi:two-component system nitrate/nitrite response regulator NarL
MTFDASLGEQIIRVLVADNSRIHTQLLADALRRDRHLEVIASASHSRDLIEAITTHNIEILVLSSNLDEEPLRGLEVLRELHAARPEIRAIVLLDSSKREIVVEAFRAGARGVFSRHESVEALAKCVRQVHNGQVWANSQQMLYVVEALASSPVVRAVAANGMSLLSNRELEVIRCLAEGLSNREIAQRLGLSQHTIKNYLFRVFDKLGVSSRMELLYLTLSQPTARQMAPQMPVMKNPGDGDGVQTAEGLALCRKAAEQGLPTAQIALAQKYQQGKGVPRDLVSAYMWYLVSERTSLFLRDEISVAKRQLAEFLSAEQMLEAENKALEHLRKKPRSSDQAAALTPSARGSS